MPSADALADRCAQAITGAMTLRCIDIETTGIDGAIVEIASVDLQRDTSIQETLARPSSPVPAIASAEAASKRFSLVETLLEDPHQVGRMFAR
jgi:hypothetical protein